jgi:beta-N-acetylhexosaminidase
MEYADEVRPRAVTSIFALSFTIVLVAVLSALAPGCGTASDREQTSATLSNSSSTAPPAGAASSTASSTSATSRSTTVVTIPTTLPPSPAEQILLRMSLRQKAAQVLLLTFEGETLLPGTQELLAAGPPGGLLLLGKNVSGVGQLQALNAALQATAMQSEPPVGLLIAVDQEGGSVQRIHSGVPRLPAPRRLAEESTPVDAGKLAAETAAGLLALGVNMNLAPVADVVSDPKSFLYQRSYSGDPTVVVNFVEAVTEAFEKNGLICVVKHFPGHGSATGDSHGQTIVSNESQADFAKIHFRPFKAAIAAGAEGVMIGHLIVSVYDPDRPSSSSSRVIGGLLRDGLGFSGLVVADDIQMAGAAGGAPAQAGTGPGAASSPTPGEIAVTALAAGCDLIICSGSPVDQLVVLDSIVKAVESGRLPQERLDQAVLGMLGIKLRHGLVSP